jgi:hypothetical protein
MGAAVLVLAATGLARGQKPPQAGGPALVAPGETTVSVAEPGKPGEVCKILKSWKKRDGAWVHEVQSLKTGEKMTIEEGSPSGGPPGSRPRATARRVFHWGRSNKPPAGAPLPPPVAVVAPPPPARPPAVTAAPPARPVVTAAKPSGVHPAGVVIEGSPPGSPTAWPAAWPAAYASRPTGTPGRAPIPLPSVGTEVVNPYMTPHVSTAALVPQPQPQETNVQGPDRRLRPAAPGAGPVVVGPAEAAPPRRRLLSRLFGRDKEGDAERIFSAPPGPVVSPPRPAVATGVPAAKPLPPAPPIIQSTAAGPPRPRLLSRLFGRDKEGDAEQIFSAPPGPVVSPPRPAPAQRPPAAPPPLGKMAPLAPAPWAPAVATSVPPPLRPVPVTPPAAPAWTTPDYTRRANVAVAPPAPATAAAGAPAPAPVIKTPPPPVIVGNSSRPSAPAPVIVNKGSAGGVARVTGEPFLVSEPRPAAKPSSEKVTPVVTSTPVVIALPEKGKPAESAKAPAVVTGPVPEKATAFASHGREVAPVGSPRSAVTKAAEPAKSNDWRESWGKVAPAKPAATAGATARAEAVAPRPTSWSVPPQPPPADVKRADRIVFPRPGDGKPDPLADPAAYSRLAHREADVKPAEPMPRPAEGGSFLPPAPAGRRGPQAVQVTATDGNAFSPPQPAAPPQAPPTMANAFAGTQAAQAAPPQPPAYLPAYPPGYAMAQRPAYPARPPVLDAGTPAGLANAFTTADNARPIPADFHTPQFPDNGFTEPGHPAYAYAAPAPRQPVPPPMPGYFPPMAARGYGPPAALAPPQAVAPGTPQLLSMLKGSLLPSQREWAADQLSGLDWHAHPQVVDALLTAAHNDPAATVRAGCVRSLAKLKVNTVPAVAVVEGLKRDADPRVRQEAEEALIVLGASRTDSGVRPVSATGPR